jgi:hypothetical protein
MLILVLAMTKKITKYLKDHHLENEKWGITNA